MSFHPLSLDPSTFLETTVHFDSVNSALYAVVGARQKSSTVPAFIYQQTPHNRSKSVAKKNGVMAG